ncbi:hypothetical protein IRB23M11_19230 [Alkalibacterium sp. m-11]|uniref:Mechanosensitive ion channel n=1 Tax=Alkalibacterium indicireducens TaxID=398758 RepID=A0ABN1ADF0_9LACT
MNTLTNWMENSEVGFWLVGIGGLLLILLIRSAVKSILDRIINRENTQLFVTTLVNWVSIFAVAIFLFTYFSRISFMYQTLFVFGDTQITLVLILTILFALLLSIKLSNVLREYLLPSVYNKYNLDKGLRSSLNRLIHYIVVH